MFAIGIQNKLFLRCVFEIFVVSWCHLFERCDLKSQILIFFNYLINFLLFSLDKPHPSSSPPPKLSSVFSSSLPFAAIIIKTPQDASRRRRNLQLPLLSPFFHPSHKKNRQDWILRSLVLVLVLILFTDSLSHHKSIIS